MALAVAVRTTDPLPGDRWVLDRAALGSGAWRDTALVVADVTDLLPVALGAAGLAGWLLWVRRAGAAVWLVVTCGVAWVLNPVLKAVVARPRPDVVELPTSLSEHAFPAGHAVDTGVLVGALLVLCHGRSRLLVLVLGGAGLVVTVLAQLALGRHWPSDLLAGWLLAVAVVAAAAAVRARTLDEQP